MFNKLRVGIKTNNGWLWLVFCITFFSGSAGFAAATKDGSNAVQVTEFFTYMCHACHRLEPHVVEWKKANNVRIKKASFVKVPLTFDIPGLTNQAKAFEVAKANGKADSFSDLMFEKIHSRGQYMEEEKELFRLLEELGIPSDRIKKQFHSKQIKQRVSECEEERKKYKITVMPTIIVRDKAITPVTAKGYKNVFVLVDKELYASED